YFLNPLNLLLGKESAKNIWNQISKSSKTVLVYSSDTPENVKNIQKFGREKVAYKLEETFANLADLAINSGYHRLIIAGGETSGAVIKNLGYTSYYIGENIAPGVPIMIPSNDSRIRLILKSGNFGNTDFFLRALSTM